MIKLDYDLVIVGGGIVGIVLVCVLKNFGLKVVLVEIKFKCVVVRKKFVYNFFLILGRILDGIGVW